MNNIFSSSDKVNSLKKDKKYTCLEGFNYVYLEAFCLTATQSMWKCFDCMTVKKI